jgi:hypothetical protein
MNDAQRVIYYLMVIAVVGFIIFTIARAMH